ncbi:MAG: C39 family peptidase [Candidatus Melainabacteria bacterium]|nr:C39 family peptidase [Candidatus Melainabacteria bacterium]
MRVDNLPFYHYKLGMPNICQRNPRRQHLREQGKVFCAPASVANALIWQAKNYCPFLVKPQGKDSEQTTKLKLVEELAKLMDTISNKGTYINDLISGLRKYVRDRGYKVTTKWKGLDHRDEYHCTRLTDPRWLMESLMHDSNLILDIDITRAKSPVSKKPEAHCVTAVGFFEPNNQLYIHDPISLRRKPSLYEIDPAKHWKRLKSLKKEHGRKNDFFEFWEYDPWRWGFVGILQSAIAFRVFKK